MKHWKNHFNHVKLLNLQELFTHLKAIQDLLLVLCGTIALRLLIHKVDKAKSSLKTKTILPITKILTTIAEKSLAMYALENFMQDN